MASTVSKKRKKTVELLNKLLPYISQGKQKYLHLKVNQEENAHFHNAEGSSCLGEGGEERLRLSGVEKVGEVGDRKGRRWNLFCPWKQGALSYGEGMEWHLDCSFVS